MISKFRKINTNSIFEGEQFKLWEDVPTTKNVNGVEYTIYKDDKYYILVNTPNGVVRADNFDWIIKNENNEFYVVKFFVFERTYELV